MSRVEKGTNVQIVSVSPQRSGRKLAVVAVLGVVGLLAIAGSIVGIAFSTGKMYIDVPTLTVRIR